MWIGDTHGFIEENSPLLILEALSAHTPVLASKIGGLPEISHPIDPKLCRKPADLTVLLRNLEWVDSLRNRCREVVSTLLAPWPQTPLLQHPERSSVAKSGPSLQREAGERPDTKVKKRTTTS